MFNIVYLNNNYLNIVFSKIGIIYRAIRKYSDPLHFFFYILLLQPDTTIFTLTQETIQTTFSWVNIDISTF